MFATALTPKSLSALTSQLKLPFGPQDELHCSPVAPAHPAPQRRVDNSISIRH